MSVDKKARFIARFVEEAREHIGKLNEGLVSLESNPGNMDIVNQIFRSAHTIKGSSKILQLNEINQVSHKLEDALDALRAKKIPESRELFNLIFRAVDVVTGLVDKTEAGETITDDNKALCEELEQAAKGNLAVSPAPPPTAPAQTDQPQTGKAEGLPPPPPTSAQAPVLPPKPAPKPITTKPKTAESVRISTEKLDETVKLMGEIVSNHVRMKQNLTDIDEIAKFTKKYLDILARNDNQHHTGKNGGKSEIAEMAQTLYAKLKRLSGNTKDVLNFQTLLTDDLREKVLKMRMLPLSTTLDSFPRLVRDIAAACNKSINFVVEGGETELDKKIIEKIGDPLLHMIRNSLDHGIETADARLKAGKPATGTIKLSASYEGGHVLIILSDDGGGIPVKKIKEKALRQKLFDEETLNRLPEQEIINLIFRPGFSTSAAITDISGRGVGMDVVKENIVMQLKGSVQIETAEGKGTRFFIRLPLTLAVMRILLISLDKMDFAIPLTAIREIIKISRNEIIDIVNKRAISLRNQIIPVANLRSLLGMNEAAEKGDLHIVLITMGNETLGLIVDAILSEEDMEIKALPPNMKKNEVISGVTLSGKNEVVLVLHVPKLFALAKESKEGGAALEASELTTKTIRILLVEDSDNAREIEKNILESYGYLVDTALNGAEGLRKALETKYDAIVTDIEMPEMDGFALTEKLRQTEIHQYTPIIIVSSNEKEHYKKKGMLAGASAYIVKSGFDQAALLDTIENLIKVV